jgi:hypothetical protein
MLALADIRLLIDDRREDLITKLVEHDYRAEAQSPQFIRFVGEATGKENVRFLQKCLGHSITGDTREKKLFLCCGAKDRGKTTLLELIAALLGGLCASLSVESLLCSERFTNSAAAGILGWFYWSLKPQPEQPHIPSVVMEGNSKGKFYGNLNIPLEATFGERIERFSRVGCRA